MIDLFLQLAGPWMLPSWHEWLLFIHFGYAAPPPPVTGIRPRAAVHFQLRVCGILVGVVVRVILFWRKPS